MVRAPAERHLVEAAEDDVFQVLVERVLLRLRRTGGVADLTHYVLCLVLDEYCVVWVALAHLRCGALQPHQHMVGEDHRRCALRRVRVLDREHVDLALVDAELAEVDAEHENVGRLHARVYVLREREVIALFAPHNLHCALDSVGRCELGDAVDELEVLALVLADEVERPHELDVVEVHAAGAEYLDEVHADVVDPFHVAAHFVVQLRKDIGDVEDHCAARFDERVRVDGGGESLCNVHATARLKSVICAKCGVSPEKLVEAINALSIFGNRENGRFALVNALGWEN